MISQEVDPGSHDGYQRSGSRTRHSRKGGSLLVRLMPLVFAAVLVGAVAGGLWNAANAANGSAPPSLDRLQLTGSMAGPEAVAEMSKLHGKGIGVVDGYVAHYDGGTSGGAILYVGEAASEKEAALLTGQMEERIGAGNQYFTDLKSVTVDGVKLYSVRSRQENHYFWQAGNKVIWIGFDRDDQAALSAAVKAFR